VTEQLRLSVRDYQPRSWTVAEVQYLREHGELGAKALALVLGRTERSVVSAAARLRISLRPAGERRGHVLGQPRTEAWAGTQLRADVLAGEVDMAALEARAREIALGLDSGKPVCPACGARPQQRPSTGLCEPCHLRALAAAHRENDATKQAQRELWRARQEASRSKRAKAGT
jgi:hypothetical protein